MLRELRLRNLAIAADVTVELGPGLNVLTGSTGAGKSLVVEALRWLTGEPVERGLIRSGAEQASAEALFDLAERPDLLEALTELGIAPSSDGCVRLRREVRAGGRSRAFIDASAASAAMLAAICERLVELQSQHEQARLLSPAAHAALLDGCGVPPAAVRAYQIAFDAHAQAQAAAAAWRARRSQVAAQRDLLQYQLNELEAARLREGELDPLRQRVARLAGGARLLTQVAAAHAALADEEHGAIFNLGQAQRQLGKVAAGMDELERALENVAASEELAAEAVRTLARLLDEADADPGELDRAQARLAELEALSRKYGRSESELVAMRERLRGELDELAEGDELPAPLASMLVAAVTNLETTAAELHAERKRVAKRAAKAAGALLAELGMPQAALQFGLELRTDESAHLRVQGRRVAPTREGAERVRLEVRTNRGEALGPVERIASGGELSRLALVLRTISATRRQPALVILDEVDTGLSADLGVPLARRLRAMADEVQLLVITHLPAVAAAGDRHLAASKQARGERVLSDVTVLRGEERIHEIARMLGGDGDVQRRHARHLLRSIRGAAREEATA